MTSLHDPEPGISLPLNRTQLARLLETPRFPHLRSQCSRIHTHHDCSEPFVQNTETGFGGDIRVNLPMVFRIAKSLWPDNSFLHPENALHTLDHRRHREFTRLVRKTISLQKDTTFGAVRDVGSTNDVTAIWAASRSLKGSQNAGAGIPLPDITARLCTPTIATKNKQRKLTITLDANDRPLVHLAPELEKKPTSQEFSQSVMNTHGAHGRPAFSRATGHYSRHSSIPQKPKSVSANLGLSPFMQDIFEEFGLNSSTNTADKSKHRKKMGGKGHRHSKYRDHGYVEQDKTVVQSQLQQQQAAHSAESNQTITTASANKHIQSGASLSESSTMRRLSSAYNAGMPHNHPAAKSTEEDMVEILSKKFNDRKDSELKRLFTIIRGIKAFARLDDFLLRQLLCVFSLVEYEKDRIVFRQGESGTSWYVILQGSVDVLANKFDNGGSDAEPSSGRSGRDASHTEAGTLQLSSETDSAALDAIHLRKESTFLLKLEKGLGFGELALMNDAKRAASIVTAEPCKLLRVEKRDYNRILRFMHDSEQKEKIMLIRKSSALKNMDDFKVKVVAGVIQMKTFQPDTILLEAGKPIETVGIINSGQCEVLATLKFADPKTGDVVDRHVRIAHLHPGDYYGEQGVAKIPEDAPPIVSAITVRTLEPTVIGIIPIIDARTRIQDELVMQPWVSLAIDTSEVILKYYETRHRQKWILHKRKVVDSLMKERFLDPNMTRSRFLEYAGKDLQPFRFQ